MTQEPFDTAPPAHAKRLLQGVLAGIGLAWMLVGSNHGLCIYDEGLSLVYALRILKGEVLYRDIFTNYGPAYYYLVAGLFRIVTPSVLVQRLVMVAVGWVLGLVVWALARSLSGPKEALLATFLVMTWPVTSYLCLPALPATLFVLASLWALHRSDWSGQSPGIFAAGILAGMATLFRHDFGLATLGVETALLVLSRDAKGVFRLLSAWLAVVALPCALLLANVPLSDLYNDLVFYPSIVYRYYSKDPLPGIWEPIGNLLAGNVSFIRWLGLESARLQFYYAVFVGTALAAACMRLRAAGAPWSAWRQGRTVAALALLEAAFAFALWQKPDALHTLPPVASGAILVSWAASKARSEGRRWAVVALACLQLAVAFDRGLGKLGYLYQLSLPGTWRAWTLPRARGIIGSPDMAVWESCIRYVQERVPPGEPIFVGNEYHYLLHGGNDELFYFLSERDCATKFDNLAMMCEDAVGVQTAIVGDLERKHVRTIVLVRMNQEDSNAPRQGTVLDDYIDRHFELDRAFGDRAVFRRKPPPPPSGHPAGPSGVR